MNTSLDWWGSLKHGGLLIAPQHIAQRFAADLPPLPAWRAERLRRALTAFDGSNAQLGPLLDHLLQDLAELPEGEWSKAQGVDARL